MGPKGFQVLVHQIGAGALGTGPIERLVPGNELAVGVVVATIENTTCRSSGNHLSVHAEGALDAQRDRLGRLTLGIFGTGQEFPEPAHLDHHGGAALGALFVRNGIRIDLDGTVSWFLSGSWCTGIRGIWRRPGICRAFPISRSSFARIFRREYR